MFNELMAWPAKLTDGAQLAKAFYERHGANLPKNSKQIAFVGMGGSGIAGRLVKMVFDKESEVPAVVVEGTCLPLSFNAETFAIVCSYSGNTWETRAVLNQLLERGIPFVVLTHGGAIADTLNERGIPFIYMSQSRSPRSALGSFLGSIFWLLDLMGYIRGKELVYNFIRHAEHFGDYGLTAQEHFEPFIRQVGPRDFFHIWGIAGDSDACMYRAQTQFNENSKVQAAYNSIPELMHNLFTSFIAAKKWTDQTGPGSLWAPRYSSLVVIGHTEFVDAHLRKASNAAADILSEHGIDVYKPAILGDTWDEQLMHMLLWADFASYYLGKSRNVNIEAVELIEGLKKRI